ncbi:Flp pilus assembly protein TadG [Devosia sp. UYZn731]|uniref:TadE/TadG family type IV pilus assembly protein n=1 Tax=Devosia sp. UYZn731 TaxID=3156345 RepID=UPI00339B7AB5
MTHSLASLIGRSLAAPLARFWRDESGVTAIEFGILATPFFAILGAILETSVVFLSSAVLDSAVLDASRQIRTGQLQAQNYTVAKFEDLICNRLYGLFQDCHALQVRVSTVSNFTSATITPPLSTTCTTTCPWVLTEDFNGGQGSSTVIVQVYYKWPIILRMGAFASNDQPDGTRLLGAVQVFRNEPFSS